MKPLSRNILYGALVVFCTVFTAFIFINGSKKTTLPELRPRQGALANAPEWTTTQATVKKLQDELTAKPDDPRTTLLLAKEFMQEGRITGDYSYYNKASLDLVNKVLAKDSRNFEAICLKSMIYLSQHRFSEGKNVAMEAVQSNPYNSFVYGLLCDANVELGNYDEAVSMADKMVSIRPDIRSYSRVSYIREIFGDLPGAIDAIHMAIAAGFPGQEDTEWARMVLGHLYEDSNQLDKATEQYQAALNERPDYPFALAGMGRIAAYKKDYPAAIQYYEKARIVISEVSFLEQLAILYRLNNQQKEADEYARVTLNALLSDNITAQKDKDQGHYSDMELANLYLQMNEPAKALPHAQAEHQRRPQNIDACETLAWVLYRNGQAAEALPYITTALRTKSQHPERLVKAGIIMLANGQKKEGTELINKGLSLKPYMDETIVKTAQSLITG
ncbi:MAG: tetratricopeptide repeat protein [Saprospiraceae bacterium]|nr:tetratricopeptide repeat protein [Saprospiraceae bacterium]